MKTSKLLLLLILVSCIIGTGCSRVPFAFTRVFDNTTIEIHDAKEGEETESNWFTVGKDQTVTVESALEKGSVQIEFVEVDVMTDSELGDEIYPNEVKEVITVNPGDQTEVKLEADDYIMRLNVLSETKGTIEVRVEKKK